jgi:carbon monoxide dehydrogenase subunit G
MVDVKRSLHVEADPARVIEYISDVSNHPAFIPPLKDVTNLSGDPKQVGTRWDWTFTMAGVQVKGHAETVDYVSGKKFSFRTTGIDSTFKYEVEPDGGGSRLTATVSYEVPEGVLAKIADRAVVARINEGEADHAVKNLQTIFSS